jgi:hypothetical protein
MTDDEAKADAAYQAQWDALGPLLTPAFLQVLTTAARLYGDDGDSVAVADFVTAVYGYAHQPVPDLTPFTFP